MNKRIVAPYFHVKVFQFHSPKVSVEGFIAAGADQARPLLVFAKSENVKQLKQLIVS
jgi:hypothetical protein